MRHFFALGWVWLISCGAAWAQAPQQPARFELALQPATSDVEVLPLPDSSVILLVHEETFSLKADKRYFQKLDAGLQPVWQKPLVVEREYELVRTCSEGAQVYALFQSMYRPTHLLAVHLNGRTGTIETSAFDTRISRDIFELKALSGRLFATVLVDQHLTILHLDLLTQQMRFLPSVYEQLPAQFTFLADSVTKRAAFVLTQTNGLKSRLQLKQLSQDGQLLRTEFIQAESERNLITAQLSPGDSATRLVTGTYTLRDPRYSQGLFAADLNAGTTPGGGRNSMRFYDFLSLKHFFDFMNPAREARIRERGARRRAAGSPMRLHYRLFMHDMLPTPEGYVMAAEVYYPRYRYSSYGGPMTTSYRQFDGYRTTHTIVCGFDRQGNLLWDNTFVLKNVETFDVQQTVRLRPLPDGRLALAYLDEEDIRYKIIDRTKPSPNDLLTPLRTNLAAKKEKVSYTLQEDLVTWTGTRFLAHGYQHVRPDKGTGRDVFFVNAVVFE
ncbi:hypothetical protein [Hymenobacter guriensis]|uniref:Uncharacterized protein n=1 Tax=Hymenobacter guriensis TaxID=2793065 RepID=A0ABS0KXW4_9BACT|nr:hypothetical protein [Hymenobacter guriensis]MBG8552713.1 hypothetical protein [Hymenobacter guriensis]